MKFSDSTLATIRERNPIADILTERGATVHGQGKERRAQRCPAREHSRPDAVSVNIETGQWHCHVCNSGGDVFAWLQEADALTFPQAVEKLAARAGLKLNGNGSKPISNRTIAATYDYKDETGKLLFQCVRYTPKDFRQRRPDGTGWAWNLDGVRLVPYRLPELLKAGDVFIAEGEKDADTLVGLGFVATCNPMGAGKWRGDYNVHFAGKRVTVIPDNDEPGRRHVEQVARALHGVAASVKILTLPGEVKDASDYVATFSDPAEAAERLALLAEGAPAWTPTPEPPSDQPATIPSTTTLPPWTDAATFVCTPQTTPPEIIKGVLHQGGKAAVCGSSKSKKSWTLLDMAVAVSTGSKWLNFETTQAPVCFVNFELPIFAIHHRLKAIAAARGITVTDALSLWNLRGHSAPYNLIIPQIIEQTKGKKFGLIILDPSYKLLGDCDENSARDIALLLNELERLAVETGAAVAFTAHFAKGNASGKDAQDRMSGSGVFARDPDSILVFTALETEDCYAVETVLRTLPPQPPFSIRWSYPVFSVAGDVDPGDLKQPRRSNTKTTPTADQLVDLFKTDPKNPRTVLLSAVQLRVLFDARGWDRTAAPAVRDQLVAEGKLAIYHGAHNSKLTGLPDMVAAYTKQQADLDNVLEQAALPATTKRKPRR